MAKKHHHYPFRAHILAMASKFAQAAERLNDMNTVLISDPAPQSGWMAPLPLSPDRAAMTSMH